MATKIAEEYERIGNIRHVEFSSPVTPSATKPANASHTSHETTMGSVQKTLFSSPSAKGKGSTAALPDDEVCGALGEALANIAVE